jgi:hypothetical protein
MKNSTLFAAALLALASAAACSKSAPAPTTPAAAPHEGEHKEGEEAHAHGAEGTPVAKFHDALSPLWHAPAGAQRTTDTCNAVGSLHGIANEILGAGAPAGAAADYLDAAKALETSVGALHAECETAERKDFEAKFAVVHESFHAVADKAGQ